MIRSDGLRRRGAPDRGRPRRHGGCGAAGRTRGAGFAGAERTTAAHIRAIERPCCRLKHASATHSVWASALAYGGPSVKARLGRPPIADKLAERIRTALAGSMSVRKMAAKFDVNPSTVQRISRPFDGAEGASVAA
jgi:hypothetical protein